MKLLNLALLSFARDKKHVLLCLDEAQAMPLETLEMVRLISNLETEKRKLVQVILFGQPELDEKLRQESIRQLRQRISFQHRLGSLTRRETDHYLKHRLSVAGYRADRAFTGLAVGTIHRASRGIPRLVNILANKAMMLAYGKGSGCVDWACARAAVADTPSAYTLAPLWIWLALLCVAGSGLGWILLA
jgi:MSHA biogenesis protein MshM